MKNLITVLLSLTFVNFSYTATQKSWTPKYKSARLKKLKTKIKPTKKHNDKLQSNVAKSKIIPSNDLEKLYLKKAKSKDSIKELKAVTLMWKQKAVPTLTKVMKSKNYPEENRWVATFMLGRIMGVKSAEYISKFTKHPNWMLRLASLKVLLHLKQKKYEGIYSRMLEDDSMIIRHQALQNIRDLKLKKLAPYVWKMLYNKSNYVGKSGSRKRASIIKDAIKTVGELEFNKAKKPLLTMMQKNKYKDVFEELDYSLSKITKKISPSGSLQAKQFFWRRIALKEMTI